MIFGCDFINSQFLLFSVELFCSLLVLFNGLNSRLSPIFFLLLEFFCIYTQFLIVLKFLKLISFCLSIRILQTQISLLRNLLSLRLEMVSLVCLLCLVLLNFFLCEIYFTFAPVGLKHLTLSNSIMWIILNIDIFCNNFLIEGLSLISANSLQNLECWTNILYSSLPIPEWSFFRWVFIEVLKLKVYLILPAPIFAL